MARLIYSDSAFRDFERILDHYADEEPDLAGEVVGLIQEALQVLERHPLIGREAEAGMRELVISRGKTGFVALYDFLPQHDVIRVLALRHQLEAGYPLL